MALQRDLYNRISDGGGGGGGWCSWSTPTTNRVQSHFPLTNCKSRFRSSVDVIESFTIENNEVSSAKNLIEDLIPFSRSLIYTRNGRAQILEIHQS